MPSKSVDSPLSPREPLLARLPLRRLLASAVLERLGEVR